MSRNLILILVTTILELSLVTSCSALSPTTPQLASTSDPNLLSTSIVATSEAAKSQTSSAQEQLLITQTQTPTATLAPQISTTGTSLIELPDGSTQFIDHLIGIEVTIPVGWLSLRINEREFINAWANEAVQNSAILDALSRMSQMNPKYVRFVTFDIQPDHRPDLVESNVMIMRGFTSNLDDFPSVHLNQVRERFPDLNVISSQTGEVTSVPIIKLEYTYTAINLHSGKEDKIYKKEFFFSANDQVVSIIFTTHLNLKEIILPQAEQIINSLVIFPSDYSE